jgi:hypothetical protein
VIKLSLHGGSHLADHLQHSDDTELAVSSSANKLTVPTHRVSVRGSQAYAAYIRVCHMVMAQTFVSRVSFLEVSGDNTG